MVLRRLPLSIIISLLAFLVLVSAIYSISLGAMDISFYDSLSALFYRSEHIPNEIYSIIHNLRLPRTLLCLLVGMILAICGTVMQGLFRNPLADPGIIGVSAGSALGAAFAIVLIANVINYLPQAVLVNINSTLLTDLFLVPFFAFIGGALTTFIVYRLGTTPMGTSVTIMLLSGVAIGALAGAGLGYLNFIATDQMLRDISLWSMGSLAGANSTSLWLTACTALILLIFFYRQTMSLNALLLGEAEAKHLGVSVQKLKRQCILLVAVGVGVCVSVSGMIGFIGLVIPHLGRMLVGPDHRRLLPVSALLGALLLTCADMLARTLVVPAEMPIGIITALIGAPFFIYLLFQQKGRLY